MKVALVHDWLTGMRGGERVLEELCVLFPDARIFTLFHKPGSVSRRIESLPIQPSFLNRIPGAWRHYRYMLPLFPWAMSRFDLKGFDLVLSVSHAAAKGIRKPPGSVHICYCLTPMRYLWDMQRDYFHYADPVGMKRTAVRALAQPLRLWDRQTACAVDHFVAASFHVQDRVLRCYCRTSEMIYPPVDTEFFTPSRDAGPADFYLVVSALVPYKRIDLVIEAFNRLGYPLVVVGAGPDLGTLKRRAKSNIDFRGYVTNESLRDLYRSCRAAIITAREDFGLVSLEVQACGRPPVAYAAGGSLETVSDSETGILYDSQTVDGLIEGVRRLEKATFDPEQLRRNAERFAREKFRDAIIGSISKHSIAHSADPALTLRVNQPEAPDSGAEADKHPSLTGLAGIAKRGLDITVSLFGLLALGLPLLLLAALIRRESEGPSLYFQTRLGFRGRRFVMIKLRTMYVDAELTRGPTWATKNDRRCTRLGGFLRRYGIDELPQLWNVLLGDMSLVGPRPERPEFQTAIEVALPEFRQRMQVKGGISGLAQIRGWRGDTSIEERLKSDLEYIAHWRLWRDLLILCATPFSLLMSSEHSSGDRQGRARNPQISRTVRFADDSGDLE